MVMVDFNTADTRVYPPGGKYCVKVGVNVLFPVPVRVVVWATDVIVLVQLWAASGDGSREEAPNINSSSRVAEALDNWILYGFTGSKLN